MQTTWPYEKCEELSVLLDSKVKFRGTQTRSACQWTIDRLAEKYLAIKLPSLPSLSCYCVGSADLFSVFPQEVESSSRFLNRLGRTSTRSPAGNLHGEGDSALQVRNLPGKLRVPRRARGFRSRLRSGSELFLAKARLWHVRYEPITFYEHSWKMPAVCNNRNLREDAQKLHGLFVFPFSFVGAYIAGRLQKCNLQFLE
jgi:hypothetical protein